MKKYLPTPRQMANDILCKQAEKIIALKEAVSNIKTGWVGTSVRYHVQQACNEIAVKARWDAMQMWRQLEDMGEL